MVVADEKRITQDLLLEIHSPWAALPPAVLEIEKTGVRLERLSRLIRVRDLEQDLDQEYVNALIDPLIESVTLSSLDENLNEDEAVLDVFCRPGVTDGEGDAASLALAHAGLPDTQCQAGTRYRLSGVLSDTDRTRIEGLLGNHLIHEFIWGGLRTGYDPFEVQEAGEPTQLTEAIVLPDHDQKLQELSRALGLALDVNEMRAIADYFRRLGRPATDVELQSLALAWSEHCSHKTFKATIEFDRNGRREIIPGLLQTFFASPTASLKATWVQSAFVDNAGMVTFDDEHDLAIKVETHNHPSALEPYGGAHTGVGGVIRDVLAVSADPIASTDVLCFGPTDLPDDRVPVDAHHPALTYREVVRGIADYGNNMGIPTVGGAIVFHPGYTANPLVYCGTIGILPRGSHPTEAQPGDAIVLIGGRTGRDGLQGATMSSSALDRQIVAGSTVQIGDPIAEKQIRDVIPKLRDEKLYHAITDCGAGGLCSAVGEMAEELGAEVDLAQVPLKYQGLRPWEIWLSEAQERMVLAVPSESLSRFLAVCGSYDVEATVIGHFANDQMLRLRYGDQPVAELETAFLQGGAPPRRLKAHWDGVKDEPLALPSAPLGPAAALLQLLAHPNIASKDEVIRRYDHEVQGGTSVKPLVGNSGPSDAAVLRPVPGSWQGVVVSHGINPLYGEDPHAMAMLAVDEALRNLVAVGGSLQQAALLDNFSWGDVDDPQELGALVLAAEGCRDAALAYGVPFISGKDSLRNISIDDAGKHSIPRTLLITAISVIPDLRCAVSMDLKGSGNRLYLVGSSRDELGGSHYLAIQEGHGGRVPEAQPAETLPIMQALSTAIQESLVLSCHDLSEGGLGVAAAEMSLAGRHGLEIDLDLVRADSDRIDPLLFGESSGRFLIEVAPEATEVEARFGELPLSAIGETTSEQRFVVRHRGEVAVDLPVSDLDTAFRRLPSPDGRSSGVAQLERPSLSQAAIADEPRQVRGPQILGSPKTMVLTAAGTNCDRETVEACRLAGGDVELVHLNQLLRGERRLDDFDFLVIPGGFSYGDHLGAGLMLANVFRHRLFEDLQRLIENGRPVLGVCNGFQVLAQLGLLGEVALAPNASGRFECRWVPMAATNSDCLFLKGLEEFELPIAHGEGRVVVPEAGLPEVLNRAPLRYLQNPNGSIGGIAGVSNTAGNVFGLMPHPERFVNQYQHPNRRAPDIPPGLQIFQNALRYLGAGR